MSRLDLDALQALAEADEYDENSGVPGHYPTVVLALVAELRAARKVVEAARYAGLRGVYPHLAVALEDYDRAVSDQ